MSLGFDWDGDGVESEDDDLFTMLFLEEDRRRLQKKSSNSSCMVAVMIPVIAIGIILKSRGVI